MSSRSTSESPCDSPNGEGGVAWPSVPPKAPSPDTAEVSQVSAETSPPCPLVNGDGYGALVRPHPDLGRQTQTLRKLLTCHGTGDRSEAGPAQAACPQVPLGPVPVGVMGEGSPGAPEAPEARPAPAGLGAKRDAKARPDPCEGQVPHREAQEGVLFLLELLGARCPPTGCPSTSGTVPGPGAEGSCPQQPLRKRRPPHRPLACGPTHSCRQAGSHLLAYVVPEMCGCRRTQGSPTCRFPLVSSPSLARARSVPPVQASCWDTGASDGPLCESLDWQARRGSTRGGT